MLTSPNRQHDRQFFYKYASAETAKSILINKTLRFSSPLLFNDPFDVARKLKFGFNADNFSKALCGELIQLLESEHTTSTTNPKLQALLDYSRTLTPKQRDILVNRLKDGPPTQRLDQLESFRELESQWQAMLPLSRILSVSTENENPVMWWSYAKNYTGAVIELECIDIYDSPLLVAKEVVYADGLPTIGSLDYWLKNITGQVDFDYKEVFENLELTKTRHWAHEKEWRVISFEKNSDQLYTDYQMHPRTFSKVFLGENISDRDRDDICKLVDFDLAHMEIFDMELDYWRRQIEFQRVRKTT